MIAIQGVRTHRRADLQMGDASQMRSPVEFGDRDSAVVAGPKGLHPGDRHRLEQVGDPDEIFPSHPHEFDEATPPSRVPFPVAMLRKIPNPIFGIHLEQAVLEGDGLPELRTSRRQFHQGNLRPDEMRPRDRVRFAALLEEVGEDEPGQIVGGIGRDGPQKGELLVHPANRSATRRIAVGSAKGAILSSEVSLKQVRYAFPPSGSSAGSRNTSNNRFSTSITQ